MLVMLSAKDFDLAGVLVVDVPSPALGQERRRVTRTPTLDGGSAVNDFGFAHADRTIRLRWTATANDDAVARRLSRMHQRVYLALPGELLECAVDSYELSDIEADMSLLVLAKLSEA